jgi:hypothetical protein
MLNSVEVGRMKYRILATALVVVLGLVLVGYGQKYYQTQEKPEEDFLGEGLGWMNIPSTEHTAEYLAKMGGIQGDPTGLTSQNVKGNWNITLSSQGRTVGEIMDLELFQIGTIVYGEGSTPDGLVATANGAIIEDTLDLNVVTVPRIALYRLKMRLSDTSAGGTFDAYSPVGYMEGSAYAKKDIPLTLS